MKNRPAGTFFPHGMPDGFKGDYIPEKEKAQIIAELGSEFGSPGRIRTGDLSINSRMLYR